VWTIETEGARGDFTEADFAVHTGKMLGEKELFAVDDGD